MNEYQVRELTPDDRQEFENVFSDTIQHEFPEYSQKARTYFVSNLAYKDDLLKGAVCLGVFAKDNLVGYALSDQPFAGVLTVRWIAVVREFQKKGLGSLLLEELEQRAKKMGVHMIQVEADDRNVDYYLSKGFIKVGLYTKGYFGMTDYLMTKLIQEPNVDAFLK